MDKTWCKNGMVIRVKSIPQESLQRVYCIPKIDISKFDDSPHLQICPSFGTALFLRCPGEVKSMVPSTAWYLVIIIPQL
jgi:hypothetical protein